jgi:excisionase family DNA binding protein
MSAKLSNEQLLLTPPQAAKLLNISERSLRKFTLLGTIPVVQLGERTYRYSVEALRAWLLEKSAEGMNRQSS